MKIIIEKPPVGGTLKALPSKSMAHRLLIASALTRMTGNPCQIKIEKSSDDIDATASCIEKLLDYKADKKLYCKESGSTFRFLLAIAGALGIECDFYPEGRLPERPLSPLYEEMVDHGCTLSPKGTVPFHISGRLMGGEYKIPGNISSQYITALLMALPMAKGYSFLEIEGELESAPYVDMTLKVLSLSGIVTRKTSKGYAIPGGQKYFLGNDTVVEGDWSNAAFWIAMSPFCQKDIRVEGLDAKSRQGDKAILKLVREMHMFNDEEHRRIDVSNIPDLVPALAVAAVGAEGTTEIVNAERLRIKESDRLRTITAALTSLGADVEEKQSGLVIKGCGFAKGGRLEGGQVDSAGDHRIAMMAAACSVLCKGRVIINDAQVVNKSYPGFFEDFQRLGGVIRKED